MTKDDGRPRFERSGEIWPMSIPTSMSWNDMGTILHLIQKYQVVTFIEIGVDHGGLAALLMARAIYNDNFHYFGVEENGTHISSRVMAMNQECFTGEEWEVPIRIDDVFSPGSVNWIYELVHHSRGTVMILCDGGNQPMEMETFQNALRVGDLILAHGEITEDQVPADLKRIHVEEEAHTRLVVCRRL